MVFVVERNEDVVLLRARARPKAFARLIMEKMTCTEKRKKRTKWMNDPTHAENTLRRRTSSYLRVTSLLETVAFKRTD